MSRILGAFSGPFGRELDPSHPLGPSLLSAYHDGDLAPAEHEQVAAHLDTCPACRERLQEYDALRAALRDESDASRPAALDRRVRALIARSTPSRRKVGYRPVLAALLLVAVLIGISLVGTPFGPNPGGPTVAAAYPCADRSECAVAVRFAGPVDRASVERSVRIDPPLAVSLSWRDDTLLVKPTAPLRSRVVYTVQLEPRRASHLVGTDPEATPVALQVVVSAPDAPPSVQKVLVQPTSTVTTSPPTRVPSPTRAAPVASPTAIAPAVSAPTLTPTTVSSPVPPAPSATAAPCAIQPTRGFGLLYTSQPAVAARLGCAQGPESSLDLAVQPFDHGRLLWLGDSREIVALREDKTWASYPDTFDGAVTATPRPGEPVGGFGKLWRETPGLRAALGMPTAPEQRVGAAMEEFANGSLIWLADKTIVATYADGTWEQYADQLGDATATPTATVTVTLSATLTPIASATASSTPAAFTASTPSASTTVPPQISLTPSPSAIATSATTETPTLTPTFTASPTEVAVCSVVPVRGFGLIYQTHPNVAAGLGCANATESGVSVVRQTFANGILIEPVGGKQIYVLRVNGTWATYPDTYQPDQSLGSPSAPGATLAGASQVFAHGQMLWTSDRAIYVLYSDGTWASFADQFVDATPTPF